VFYYRHPPCKIVNLKFWDCMLLLLCGCHGYRQCKLTKLYKSSLEKGTDFSLFGWNIAWFFNIRLSQSRNCYSLLWLNLLLCKYKQNSWHNVNWVKIIACKMECCLITLLALTWFIHILTTYRLGNVDQDGIV